MANDYNNRGAWQRLSAVFSLNDPRWGRGENSETPASGQKRPDEKPRDPNSGPPDLDEMWRDFNRRLNALFGRRGGGGNGTGKNPFAGGRNNRLGVIAVLVVIVLGWVASGIYTVQDGQAGVVLRFGQYQYTTGAGIQWRLPYPLESDEIVNMSQIRSIEIGRDNAIRSTNTKDSSMLTADENIIDVRFAVQYRISDAAAFLFNNSNVEANVAQAAQTAVREIVGKNTMDFVLYEGREQVANELAQSIQHILDSYKSGIMVSSVTLQNVQPPEQVQASFDDAVKAGQDLERQKNEAQAYANGVIPTARGSAARMQEEAEAYKASEIAQAQGDTARFNELLAEYRKAPAVTRERMYLDTMQQIYSNSSKVLVDGSKGSNNLMVLPLDKLLSGQSAAPAAAASSTGPIGATGSTGTAGTAPPAVATGSDQASVNQGSGGDLLRSRDVFRSRSRSEDAR